MVSHKRSLSICAGLSCWKMCWRAADLATVWAPFFYHSSVSILKRNFLWASQGIWVDHSLVRSRSSSGILFISLLVWDFTYWCRGDCWFCTSLFPCCEWINPSGLSFFVVIQRKLPTSICLYCSISRPGWGWDGHMPYLNSSWLLLSHYYSLLINDSYVEQRRKLMSPTDRRFPDYTFTLCQRLIQSALSYD